MAYTNTDQQVLGFLGRALSLEMTAVQQYLTLSRLLKMRGFDDLSVHFQGEANEELGHADRIIGRMLVLGVSPNMTQLRPPKLGQSLPELMSGAQALENDIVTLYQKAVDHCQRIKDVDSKLFFDKLLQEEKQHYHEYSNWQEKLISKPISSSQSK